MELKLPIALCALLLLGCQREQWDDCITSAGPLRTEERSLSEFTDIDLRDRVDLLFEDRPSNTVAVEAGRNLLDQVITEVRDGTLYIRNENRCNWVRSFKPRITVKVPLDHIAKLTVRGQGNVDCSDTIVRERFDLAQWGSEGSVRLLLDVQTVDAGLHTGAGDLKLEGRCSGEAFLFSGIMAPLDASRMRTRFVSVNNSGIADVRCWATEYLAVQLNSIGDVYYRGEPPIVESWINGTGRLLQE
jgi:hypothetical protein